MAGERRREFLRVDAIADEEQRQHDGQRDEGERAPRARYEVAGVGSDAVELAIGRDRMCESGESADSCEQRNQECGDRPADEVFLARPRREKFFGSGTDEKRDGECADEENRRRSAEELRSRHQAYGM